MCFSRFDNEDIGVGQVGRVTYFIGMLVASRKEKYRSVDIRTNDNQKNS